MCTNTTILQTWLSKLADDHFPVDAIWQITHSPGMHIVAAKIRLISSDNVLQICTYKHNY